MANTKQIIDALMKADPSGKMEVTVRSEDGYIYSLSTMITTGKVEEGVEEDADSSEHNCVILDATT